MKWVKLNGEMDANLSPAERKNFFKAISSPKSEKGTTENGFSKGLELMLASKGFKVWDEYPVLPVPLGKKAARKYEIFCGGFLYYHDVEFKKYPKGEGYSDEDGPINIKLKKWPDTTFEHLIFFEWLPKGKAPKKKLRIFINETDPKYNSDPPKPPAPPPPESNP